MLVHNVQAFFFLESKMKLFVSLMPLLFIAGCSTKLPPEYYESLNKSTLDITCASECSVSYTDPRDRAVLPTNGWDTANTAIGAAANVIGTTAPWAAITLQGLEALDNVGATNTQTNSSTNIDYNEDNSTTDNSSSVESTAEPTIVPITSGTTGSNE